ncbi:MAG: DEAD/DEAH box helicase, partial [Solirubrobacteraceae bacterium]
MSATAFGSSRPLDGDELVGAPVRYPRPSRLTAPLVVDSGPKAEAAARALGLNTVGDLLEHLPRDRRAARAVAELVAGETATVVVTVRSIASRPVRRRGMRPLVEATVADESGTMAATFFNQPWLAHRYPAGTGLVLHGKFEARNRFRVQGHAATSEASAGDGGVAHYATTEGLSSTQILALVRAHTEAIADVCEPLPARLRARERLPDRRSALAALHLTGGEAEQALGRRRLAFEELLLAQLALLRRRRLRRRGVTALALDQPRELTARWLGTMLPFTPTADQLSALDALDADLAAEDPMQRLLMGEVGSGKTVVALRAMLSVIDSGGQSALLAPTEVLASQHFRSITSMLGDLAMGGMLGGSEIGTQVRLLTGSQPTATRRRSLLDAASGEAGILVGTHALIQ